MVLSGELSSSVLMRMPGMSVMEFSGPGGKLPRWSVDRSSRMRMRGRFVVVGWEDFSAGLCPCALGMVFVMVFLETMRKKERLRLEEMSSVLCCDH